MASKRSPVDVEAAKAILGWAKEMQIESGGVKAK